MENFKCTAYSVQEWYLEILGEKVNFFGSEREGFF